MTAAARTAVVSGVAFFLILQASFNLAVKSDAVPVADPPYAAAQVTLRRHPEFFAANCESKRFLALGSSRTQAAFKAKEFGSSSTVAVNFGSPAGGPLTCHLYLRRLLAEGAKPDVMLLELHPGFLTDPPLEANWLHDYRLRPGEEAVLARFGYRCDAAHLGWRQWTAASYCYRSAVQNAYFSRWLLSPYGLFPGPDADGHGWSPGPDPEPWEKPRMFQRAAAQYAAVFDGYAERFGGPAAAAFRATVELCREKEIEPVVIVSPESGEFRKLYGPGERLADEFAAGLKCRVIDARRWLADELFSDGHHPTPAGAAEFTKRLAAEVARDR